MADQAVLVVELPTSIIGITVAGASDVVTVVEDNNDVAIVADAVTMYPVAGFIPDMPDLSLIFENHLI